MHAEGIHRNFDNGTAKADESMTATKPKAATSGKGLFDGTDNYGIYREKPKKRTHDGGWRVCIQRRSRVIWRHFKDSVYGSSEAALEQARAYRDAVVEVLPPMTNREHAVQLRRNNKTGVAGVYRGMSGSGPYWQAHIHVEAGARTRKFRVSTYGEDRAKALAIAQRHQWLSEWPVEYFATVNPDTKSKAQRQLSDRQDEEPDVLPHEMPEAEIETRLAAIDARFDAMRPARLRISVTFETKVRKRMGIVVSDAGQPARKKQMEVGLRRQTLAEALEKARGRIEGAISDLYNANVARWFMEEHGTGPLTPKHFKPDAGMRVLVLVPWSLTGKVACEAASG